MNKWFSLGTAFLCGIFLSSQASATFIFTDVTYTANSFNFTIDGDMSSLPAPPAKNAFSIVFLGDIWSGEDTILTANIWSDSPFDNADFLSTATPVTGNLYKESGETPYSWSRFDTRLENAESTGKSVSLSWTEDALNINAIDPVVEFYWGLGYNPSQNTLLGRVNPTVFQPQPSGQVPAPAPIALLAFIAFSLIRFRSPRKSI